MTLGSDNCVPSGIELAGEGKENGEKKKQGRMPRTGKEDERKERSGGKDHLKGETASQTHCSYNT